MRTELALLGALLAAPAVAAEAPVNIRFAAALAGAPFACGQTYRLGLEGGAVLPTDFRFFVSEVALLRPDGSAVPVVLAEDGRWQRQGTALLDFEDASGPCAAGGSAGINTTLRGSAEAGPVAGLRFTMGVPEALNHQDATLATAPFNVTAMFWTWQHGYKFLKVDFRATEVAVQPVAATRPTQGHDHGHGQVRGHGTGQGSGWALHLGATQCVAAAPTLPGRDCRNPNRVTVTLPGFDPARDIVVADPAPALVGVDLRHNTANTPPGCMAFPGDPECRSVLPAFGLGYDGVPPGTQTLFTARSTP